MQIIVFSEYERSQPGVVIEDRQAIQFVVPDNIICFLEADAFFCVNDMIERCHKFADFCTWIQTADAVISAGDNAQKLAV